MIKSSEACTHAEPIPVINNTLKLYHEPGAFPSEVAFADVLRWWWDMPEDLKLASAMILPHCIAA